jgi:hypothetical protein
MNQNTFKGTMKHLAETVLLNGKALSQPFISQLACYGVNVRLVEKIPSASGKGKKTNIVELISSNGIQFASKPQGQTITVPAPLDNATVSDTETNDTASVEATADVSDAASVEVTA